MLETTMELRLVSDDEEVWGDLILTVIFDDGVPQTLVYEILKTFLNTKEEIEKALDLVTYYRMHGVHVPILDENMQESNIYLL